MAPTGEIALSDGFGNIAGEDFTMDDQRAEVPASRRDSGVHGLF
jgi:hypothetical protein